MSRKKCRISQFQAGLIACWFDESQLFQPASNRAGNGRDLLVCFLLAIDNSSRYRPTLSPFAISYVIISKHRIPGLLKYLIVYIITIVSNGDIKIFQLFYLIEKNYPRIEKDLYDLNVLH